MLVCRLKASMEEAGSGHFTYSCWVLGACRRGESSAMSSDAHQTQGTSSAAPMALRGAEYLSCSPGRSLHGPALALQLTRNPPSLPKASCNSLSARASFRNDERCVLAYLQRAVYPPKKYF